MIVDGKKVACETCVKGHRASKCKHKHRHLIEIKRKGRPSTQCKQCRQLRIARKLHVKCDCEEIQVATPTYGMTSPVDTLFYQQLRSIAPKPKVDTVSPTPQMPHSPVFHSERITPEKEPCIQEKELISDNEEATERLSSPEQHISLAPVIDTQTQTKTCCKNNSPLSSSCCSKERIHKDGRRIKVVNCRCGDSCACPGCDAHPDRVMKGQRDPYTGYNTRRRLSIAAICSSTSDQEEDSSKNLSTSNTTISSTNSGHINSITADQPTAILSENGTLLCGCGCSRTFDSCSDCFLELCDEYPTVMH